MDPRKIDGFTSEHHRTRTVGWLSCSNGDFRAECVENARKPCSNTSEAHHKNPAAVNGTGHFLQQNLQRALRCRNGIAGGQFLTGEVINHRESDIVENFPRRAEFSAKHKRVRFQERQQRRKRDILVGKRRIYQHAII